LNFAYVFCVLATVRVKLGTVIVVVLGIILIVIVLVDRVYDCTLLPPKYKLNGRVVALKVDEQQKLSHLSVMDLLNCNSL
jgi:hypothetical protein